MEQATPGFAVRQVSAIRHVTNCATLPGLQLMRYTTKKVCVKDRHMDYLKAICPLNLFKDGGMKTEERFS